MDLSYTPDQLAFAEEAIWCQLFSEPGAGSDLAAISMKANKVDGGYLLTGQKVWTSGAHVSDMAICLARTNRDEDSKHFGITYFLVDMKAEGVDVRPLREITGEALFNEVFLNDVFVPDEDVLGDVDDGWRVARNTLSNERVALSGGSMIGADVEGLLKQVDEDSDPTTLERVGFLITRGQSLGLLGYRSTMRVLSGTEPGATASVRNLAGSEHGQDVAQLTHELLGADAATMEDVAAMTARGFLFQRAVTIYGGTSEVQRNIIADGVGGDVGGVRISLERLIGPRPQLQAVRLGHPQHGEDDVHRQQGGEVGHQVSATAFGKRLEQVLGERSDVRRQLREVSPSEPLADEPAELLLAGWVEEQDHRPVDEGFCVVDAHQLEDRAPRGAEGPVVPTRRVDVRVAGQRVEVQLIVAVHRRVVPQPSVGRIRIDVELPCVGIELHGFLGIEWSGTLSAAVYDACVTCGSPLPERSCACSCPTSFVTVPSGSATAAPCRWWAGGR
jgi:hypothetical protein